MSWLLVVCIPGLLMVATFGLSRIEARLDASSETVSAADVAVMLKNALEKTKAVCAASSSSSPQRRTAGPSTQRALPQRDTSLDVANYVLPCSAPQRERSSDELPGPVRARHASNPQFRQTRHANPV